MPIEYRPIILRWQHQVVQKYSDVVTLRHINEAASCGTLSESAYVTSHRRRPSLPDKVRDAQLNILKRFIQQPRTFKGAGLPSREFMAFMDVFAYPLKVTPQVAGMWLGEIE